MQEPLCEKGFLQHYTPTSTLTQSLRHPLTRAIHFAPRIKTARRFTAKNPKNCDLLLGGYVKSPKTITP